MGRTVMVFALCVICLQIAMFAQPSQNTPAIQVLNNRPIVFEENQGQVDRSVRFLAHTRNSGIFFTPSEVVLALYPSNASADAVVSDIRLKWVGGNAAPRIAAEKALAGKVNYLVGKDPAKWHTDVPTYSRVHYRGLYRGVDAVFYGTEGKIEYDLVIAPGADVRQIRFAFEGVRSVSVGKDGDLLLTLNDGEVRQHLPKVYQEVDGQRRTLAASYVINSDNTVGYRVDGADQKGQLIIDPVLSYSSYIGSSTADSINAVAVDQFGRAYATGSTVFGFPTKNALQGNRLSTDAFVTKFWATGGGLIYSTYLGGNTIDIGYGIAVDRNGNAYVGGITDSVDFPVTPGAFHIEPVGPDGFVSKLSASGSALVYSLILGGVESDAIYALALDSQHRVYVTGGTCSQNFPVKNAFQPVYPGQDCSNGGFVTIVARLNATGSDLDYSTYLDGSISSTGIGIAVDSTFHAYVTGRTSSANFPTTPGAFQRTFKAATIPGDPRDIVGTNAFVTKFSADGLTLVYSTFLGGTASDEARAIAVDGSDRAYVTGVAHSKDFPVKAGGFQTTLRGTSDAFVTKLWKDGAGLIYSTFLGGFSNEGGNSIAVDSSGQAHVAGSTTSSASFPLRNAIQATFRGVQDAFVTKVSAGGGSLIYSTFLGGSQSDTANCVRLDGTGAAYVGGVTNSTNFPTTSGAYSRTLKGETDGWIAKIKP
jgi:hypothetical protein